MNPSEMLRIVDAIHRDKNIDKEIVFEGIEAALVSAAKKHYGEEADIVVKIDREDGSISRHARRPRARLRRNGRPHRRPDRQAGDDPEDSRGGARRAVRRIHRADRPHGQRRHPALRRRRGDGRARPTSKPSCRAASRFPAKRTMSTSACGPPCSRSARAGSRVKVILSRTRPQLVQRLFEQEIPEIADGVIEIRAMAREPGYRSKVAVSQQRPARRLRRRLRRRARQPHQEHRRRAGRRADRHRPLGRQPRSADSQRAAAGRSRAGDPLQDARPGDRAGARGSAVAGHRPPRAERAAGQQALAAGTSRS